MTRFRTVEEVLDTLAPRMEVEEEAWGDVLARAAALDLGDRRDGRVGPLRLAATSISRRWGQRPSSRPRRVLVLVALLVLAFVLVAAASYALGYRFVTFSTSPKATGKVVKLFSVLPHVMTGEARFVGEIGGHGLTVIPREHGGWCAFWTGTGGPCLTDRSGPLARRLVVGDSVDFLRGGAELDGYFVQAAGERLEVSFADGRKAEIPFVWVTAPIDAGFFFYPVPDDHLAYESRPLEVTLEDGHGKVLDGESVVDITFRPGFVMHRLPGYSPVIVPAPAFWAERRQLFALRTATGHRLGLWSAPAIGGGTCVWSSDYGTALKAHRLMHFLAVEFGSSSGCSSVRSLAPTLPELGLRGGRVVCCEVRAEARVVRVEARFEDGDRIELRPRSGYLMWLVPPRHLARHQRLQLLVGFDRAGHPVTRIRVSPTTPSVYQ